MLKNFVKGSFSVSQTPSSSFSLTKTFNYTPYNSFSSFNKRTDQIIKKLDIDSVKSTNVKVATCNLNQWALDFEGNKRRIIQSLEICREQQVAYRLGPELEVTGYGCEDHFLEIDTVKHSWEVVAEIISMGLTKGMICDIGLPVIYRDVLYNSRAIILDGKILMIRPKTILADDGNYREGRYFTAWKKQHFEDFTLSNLIRNVTGQ